MNVKITDKADPLAGYVFVYEGAQTLFGRLREDVPGQPYLEPVYVYRIAEVSIVDPKTGKKVDSRLERSLHPLYGFPEIRRKDLATRVGTSVEELLPESRAALAALVDQYEAKLREKGLASLRL